MIKINCTAILGLCCLVSSSQLVAQDMASNKCEKSIKVQKYTVMEQYEPELILSVNERVRLKKERIATIKRRRGILDTLNIPDRRKQRLLKELLDNPFSDKLNKAVADIEFAEEQAIDN